MTAPMVFVKSQFFLRASPHRFGVVERLVPTKLLPDSIDVDVGVPSPHPLVPRNTKSSAGIVATEARIPLVFGVAHMPQVDPSIIGTISVDMVDLTVRPLASLDRPNNAVRQVHLVEQMAGPITPSMCALERLTALKSDLKNSENSVAFEHLSWSRKHKQLARLRLVAKQLAAQFWRDIGIVSHGADPLRLVRAARSLVASAWPVHHTRITVCSQRYRVVA